MRSASNSGDFVRQTLRIVRTAVVKSLSIVLASVICFFAAAVCSAQDTTSLRFHVTDADGKLVPCRIHLRDSAGVAQKPADLPFWKDHFVCSGEASINLVPGEYSWEIERGPEFGRLSGTVTAQSGKTIKVTQTLTRLTSLRDEGLYSGDLHVHRAVSDIKLLMSAEDLDFAPVIGWWNQPAADATPLSKTEFSFEDGRIYCTGAGEDEREGGALLYFGLKKALDLTVRSREFPSPMNFVTQARQQNPNVWIDIEKPFWWDVPTWLAVAKPDSIAIAHNHMHRSGVLGNEAWGRPRDADQYPGVLGNGLWTQQIYYHILNSGIRLPPSAGSASGVLPNPVGYNRVYVQLGDAAFTRNNWFNALKAGRCFVTNGPLLRVKANGTWPGADIPYKAGSKVDLEIALDSNDRVSQLEVIHNGNIIKRVACSEKQHQTINTTVMLPESGWFLVRAITDVEHTFRFASTAPWYVPRTDGGQRISRRSAQFFLAWIDERIERVKQNVADATERDLVLRWHYEAREFWRERQRNANADLSVSRNETWQQSRDRLINVVRRFGGDETSGAVIRDLKAAKKQKDFVHALEPLVALRVSVNPESRVKVDARRTKLALRQRRPQRFLVEVENMAGITAPLNLSGIDVAMSPPGPAKWCTIEIIDSPFTSRFLTGAEREYKVLQVTPHIAGLREIRIAGDAGQGTQDLGFRATTDVLLDVESKGISK